MSNPNNPFGIPNEMFDAIIASAIMGSVAPGMKKPNPDAGARNLHIRKVQKLQRKSMIPMLKRVSQIHRHLNC